MRPAHILDAALAHARLAASVGRRSRSRPARRPLLAAALSPALGSPPSLSAPLPLALGSPHSACGAALALAPLGSPPWAALSLTLGSPPSPAPGSPLRWGGALAHARFAALCLRRRSRSARFAALCFGAAVSGGGKGSLCDLSGGAPAPLGSPLRCGVLAHARLAALWRRSRSARLAASVLFCAALVPKLLKK